MTADVFQLILGCTNARQLHLVLESGCDVNVRNDRKETPLMVCLSQVENSEKRKSILRTLLYFGADVNARNARQQTALMYACILDQIESVVLLLHQTKIDVNAQDGEGNTALIYACSLGNAMTVKILLNIHLTGTHRFDLAATNKDGLTCLQKAIEGRYASVVALLSRAQKSDMKKQYYSAEGNVKNTKKKAAKIEQEEQVRPKSGLVSFRSDVHPSSSGNSLKAFVSGSALHSNHDGKKSVTESVNYLRPPSGKSSRRSGRGSSRAASRNTPRPPSATEQHMEREHTFISEDYEREGGEKVEDLVLAVRQCAADIRQICKDYDIKYTRSEDQSGRSSRKEKDDRKSKSSNSVNSNSNGNKHVSSRKQRKNQNKGTEEELAELVNRHDAHPPQAKDRMKKSSKAPWPITDSSNEQSPPISVVITEHPKTVSPEYNEAVTPRPSPVSSKAKSKFVPKFVVDSRNHDSFSEVDLEDSRRTRNPKTKLSVQQLLQIPINDSTSSSSNNFPQGKPKRTKAPSEGKAQETSRNRDLNSRSMELRRREHDGTEDVPWSPRMRQSSMEAENDLSLPPLRESLRSSSRTERPVKLQGMNKDVWRMVEPTGGHRSSKR